MSSKALPSNTTGQEFPIKKAGLLCNGIVKPLPNQSEELISSSRNKVAEREKRSIFPSAIPCGLKCTNGRISDECLKEMVARKKLKRLELRDCNFIGDSIAKTLVGLINHGLETLVLSGSDIAGKDLEYIGKMMNSKNALKDLDLSHITLDEREVKAVAKIMSKANQLNSLNMDHCQLDGKSLKVLSKAKKITTPVKSLILSSNPDIRGDIEMIAELINTFRCEEIDVSANSLRDDHITKLSRESIHGQFSTIHVCDNLVNNWTSFGNLVKNWSVKNIDASECVMSYDCQDVVYSLQDYQGIKGLELRGCKFNDNSIAKMIVMLINQGLETLDFSGSGISGKHLQHVGDEMSVENELRELDLSHIALDKNGVNAVAKICSKASGLKKLNLHDCELNEISLKILSTQVKDDDDRVTKLILSSNPGIRDSVEIILDVAQKFGCTDIDISANSLDGSHFARLAEIKITRKISTIRVCENPIDTWGSLGKLVKNWGVENLDASQCIIYVEDGQDFEKALESYRLGTLCLYHPCRCKPLVEKLRNTLGVVLRSPENLLIDCA